MWADLNLGTAAVNAFGITAIKMMQDSPYIVLRMLVWFSVSAGTHFANLLAKSAEEDAKVNDKNTFTACITPPWTDSLADLSADMFVECVLRERQSKRFIYHPSKKNLVVSRHNLFPHA